MYPDEGERDEPAPCQCKCGKSDAAVVRGVWRFSATFDGPLADLAVTTPPARPAHRAGSTASYVGPAGNRPFYSTDDLLYGFHILRC